MADIELSVVVAPGALLGEGPLWDPEEAVLWWTDIDGCRMHRFDPRDDSDTVFEMPLRVGCFALRQGGGFVLAAEHGFWFWAPGADPEHIVDVEADRAGNRMNDGGCDRQGRLIASSMCLDEPRRPTGACWRLGPDLKPEKLADGLHVGNGIAFSPAGDRFYLADTPANTVWQHSYDPATGAVGPREVFASTADLAGAPDGATVDAEGGYWLAGVRGGQLYRFRPDGRLDLTIDIPTGLPTRPMFGGGELSDIYLTSIGKTPAEGDTLAGALFRIGGAGHTGLPEPRFAG